jgi:hypothetical protein
MGVSPQPKPAEPVPGPITDGFEVGSRGWMDRAYPLRSGVGGNCRDWIHFLHQDTGESFSEPDDPMRRIFRICQSEHRTDRLVSRLIGIEKSLQKELAGERDAVERLGRENRFIQRMLEDRDREFSILQAEFVALKRDWVWRTLRRVRCDLARLRRFFRPSRGAVCAKQSGA